MATAHKRESEVTCSMAVMEQRSQSPSPTFSIYTRQLGAAFFARESWECMENGLSSGSLATDNVNRSESKRGEATEAVRK